MENQLFTWQECCDADDSYAVFNYVELVRRIGNFDIGTKFVQAEVSWSESTLTLTQENGKDFTFKLVLTVGEQL